MQSDPLFRSHSSQGAILTAIDAGTNTTSKKWSLDERSSKIAVILRLSIRGVKT
ncbi:MAG: hypothetical protein KAT71_00770 [Gammaproteobacteria bacterium]|nr:hypothetical protein [Gammaproteobacteria bacterium]